MRDTEAAPRARAKTRFGPLLGLILAIAGLSSVLLFGGSAVAAKPPGKDGLIHACYKLKGKAKGTMRVVPAGKHCRRGERKLAWNVAGKKGSQGENGEGGEPGSGGGSGGDGSSGTAGATVPALEKQVATLTSQVQTLEKLLQGINPGQLSALLGTLPAVSSLCSQASTLTGQVNSVNGALGTTIGLVGSLIPGLPFVPASLPAFSCPS